ETFQLDDKEKTMEGDGYVIARICSTVIVILIGSSRNHFPLSSLLCPTIWVGFCLRLYLCGLSREKRFGYCSTHLCYSFSLQNALLGS
ncbi:hypothetical protein H0E87_015085, partial [Populus deltoides]